MNTYQETLEYIYGKLPMFSRIGSDAKKNGLTNILALCEALGNPHHGKQFIHVAGTNGKGSVSHMLASVLQAEGYKTGLYTSPHLHDFRERIKINGKEIAEEDVVQFIKNIQPAIETINPSFFEITVAMAFAHFQQQETDIDVIETGLGGRLDSTNIILPRISVITNIGFDHMPILGNTLAAIAAEKAGIIKKEVPVVIGETHPETLTVFTAAAEKQNTSLLLADKMFQVAGWENRQDELVVEVATAHEVDHRKYHLDLTGGYQAKNLLTVLAACRVLQQGGWQLSEKAIAAGVQQAKKTTGLGGRWETVEQHPRVILDVAHNTDGVQQLLSQLEITSYHRLHIVLGMVKDKEVAGVLSMLPATAAYYFTQAHIPRALDGATLGHMASGYGLQGAVYENVNQAIDAAKAHAHSDDLILVCGSVFLVGEVI